MVITYFGKQFFKLQLGDTVVAINPVSKDSKLKTARFGADIALVSVNHPDYNGVENLSFGDKEPFVINGPGEYEIKNIFIKGIPSESMVGGERRLNTIYTLLIDKINVCFLGAISSKDLKAESREALEGIDILFVPIGGLPATTPARASHSGGGTAQAGSGVLSASDAYQLAISLESKIIIPMDYEEGSEALKKFLKEGGAQKIEPLDKLTVKAKDIENKEGEIVLLAASV